MENTKKYLMVSPGNRTSAANWLVLVVFLRHLK